MARTYFLYYLYDAEFEYTKIFFSKEEAKYRGDCARDAILYMSMIVSRTSIQDLLLLTQSRHEDARGYFVELFSKQYFETTTSQVFAPIQINQSFSTQYALRGLHFQIPPYAQSKLIYSVHGEILDVAVDLRQDSPTFGTSFSTTLSSKQATALFVPKGFAHGFLVLSKEAIVQYAIDAPYVKEAERGIRYDDPQLNIQWGETEGDKHFLLSEKDKQLGRLEEVRNIFYLPKTHNI